MQEVTVDVHNGTDTEGEARRVSFVLSSDGEFVPGAVETADAAERTQVRYPEGSVAMGELVASWLSPEVELVEDEDLTPAHVMVVLGADFAGVAEPDEVPATTTTTPPVADGVGAGEAAGPASTTTTTTAPGWTPGQAPQGVTCD
jgi:hypothetical protein